MDAATEELIQAYKDYLTYLAKMYRPLNDLARIRGYVITDSEYLQGVKLRDRIEDCIKVIQKQPAVY
jgi:hypothetical protein